MRNKIKQSKNATPPENPKDGLFITTFNRLKLSPDVPNSFQLLPGINITADGELKKKLLTPELQAAIGQIEFDHLQRSENLVYCVFHKELIIDQSGGDERFLLLLLLWIHALFRDAWLINDHSFECDAAFLMTTDGNTVKQNSSNYLAERPLQANGSREIIEFTFADLQRWEKQHNSIESYLHKKNSTPFKFFMEKEFVRSGRAFHFVATARSSLNLGFRVAHYCSAFEALFATSSSELSYRLSERVAFYLGELGHQKLAVFNNMKLAYSIRSKLVHGDALDKRTMERLPEVSTICDQYLREIFNQLFGQSWRVGEIDTTSENIDQFFTSLIFS